MEIEILTDGKTVWVNGDEGVCLARFSPRGIDIHKDKDGQMNSESQCLDCKAEKTTLQDWVRFKAGIKKHHNITISDSYLPDFLKSKT